MRDLGRDARYARRLELAAAVLLVSTLAFAAQRELGRLPRAVLELQLASGPDRCVTCHEAAIARAAGAPAAHREHELARLGCGVCHGGTPRALAAGDAHARSGEAGRDPALTGPLLEASCARCHPPGIAGAPRLAAGAQLYLGLGCALCHGGLGGGSSLVGPELRRLGRTDPVELRAKILEPGAGSPMPVFRAALEGHEAELTDLLVYVRALGLGRLVGGPEALVDAPCTSCHQGSRASGSYRHRCPFILRGDLTCARCHPAGVPATSRDCPRLKAERPACGVCHGGGA
jgi:hypothetical protein